MIIQTLVLWVYVTGKHKFVVKTVRLTYIRIRVRVMIVVVFKSMLTE